MRLSGRTRSSCRLTRRACEVVLALWCTASCHLGVDGSSHEPRERGGRSGLGGLGGNGGGVASGGRTAAGGGQAGKGEIAGRGGGPIGEAGAGGEPSDDAGEAGSGPGEGGSRAGEGGEAGGSGGPDGPCSQGCTAGSAGSGGSGSGAAPGAGGNSAGLGGRAADASGGTAGAGVGGSGPVSPWECVRVAPEGDDAAAPSGAAPFADLQRAIDFASAHPELSSKVCVASGPSCGATGLFEGPSGAALEMRSGVSVYGGYEATGWTRCSGGVRTEIVVHTAPGILFGPSVTATTVLDGFVITNATSSAGTPASVSVDGAADARLSNDSVRSPTGGFAIQVKNAGLLTIATSTLSAEAASAAVGIVWAEDATIAIDTSTLTGNADSVVDAVLLENAPGARITNSQIQVAARNPSGRISAVRLRGNAEGSEIRGNQILINASRDATALAAEDCAGAFVVAENTLSATNGQTGSVITLEVDGACSPLIQANTIGSFGGDGVDNIAVSCAAACVLRDNPHIGVGKSGLVDIPQNQENPVRGQVLGIECLGCREISGNEVSHSLPLRRNRPSTGYRSIGVVVSGGNPTLVAKNEISAGCADDAVGMQASDARLENNAIAGRTPGCATHYPPLNPVTAYIMGGAGLVAGSNLDVHSNALFSAALYSLTSPTYSLGVSVLGSNNLFRNNAIGGNHYAFTPGAYETSATFSNNAFMNAPESPSTLALRGNLEADCYGASTDHHLSLGSPCIDTGTPVGAPIDDADGEARDATPDIGPDEWSAAHDPCTGITCSGHGHCRLYDLQCACDPGYASLESNGLTCEPDVCFENGGCDPLTFCSRTSEGRSCSACPSGYTGTGETGCVQPNPCVPNPCGNGTCTASDGEAFCACPAGLGGAKCDQPLASITAGTSHACGIRDFKQHLSCWGNNDAGQAVPPPGRFLSVAAGTRHTCALRGYQNDDGSSAADARTAVCWGANDVGQSTPPSGIFTSLVAGDQHSCGLRTNNTSVCWGSDEYGQATPPPLQFRALAAGADFTCGTTGLDTVCWGRNDRGQSSPTQSNGSGGLVLGQAFGCNWPEFSPNVAPTCWGELPFASLPPTGQFDFLRARGRHACAWSSEYSSSAGAFLNHLSCWGDAFPGGSAPPATLFRAPVYDKLGLGSDFGCITTDAGGAECWGDDSKAQGRARGGAVRSLSTANQHGCSVFFDGSIDCWGSAPNGEASPPNGPFTEVASGEHFSCGLRPDGHAECWGSDESNLSSTPSDALKGLVAGDTHACGLRSDGSAACWGANSSGQASPHSGAFTALAAGSSHTCGLRPGGSVECWGLNDVAQASPPAESFTSLSAAGNYTCGVTVAGSLRCWGVDRSGAAPPAVGAFESVAVGPTHHCALQLGGALQCWGQNAFGQSTPPLTTFRSVTTASSGQTCGIASDRALQCWGNIVRGNSEGIQLPARTE